MKIKVNNIQVLNAWSILNYKYLNTEDIKLKWLIIELADELFQIKSRFDIEKENIIKKYGIEDNEKNQKVLDMKDKHFQDLLSCESEISPIPYEKLEILSLSLDEIMVLKPFILK